MNIKYNILQLMIITLLSVNLLHAETDDKHRAGVLIGPNLIFNKTEIPLIPGADDCGTFKNGNAFSFFGGLFYSYKYLPEFIHFDARLFYEKRPVDLSAYSSDYQVLSPSTNQYVPLVRLHKYSGSLEYIAFDLGVNVKPVEQYPVFFRLGFEAGNPIISSNFEITEQITEPAGVLFHDEKLKHTVASGAINNAGTALGISLGASYSHKLKSGMLVEPGITYRKSINSVISNDVWSMDIVRFNIEIGFDISPSGNQIIPIAEPEKVIEEPIVQDEPIKSILRNISTGKIEFVETTVTQTYPILPYIFFDSLNAGLRSVYLTESSSDFNEEALPKDNILIYHKILDIVGSRMNKYPNSNLVINGTVDGRENLSEKGKELASERAETVSEYLHSKWNIDKSRLSINVLKKPTLATSEVYPEGYEENRRVELSSNDSRIFEPVIHTKFKEFKPSTNNLIVSTSTENEIKEWEIKFSVDNKNIKTFSGKNNIPTSFKLGDIIANYGDLEGKSLKMALSVKDNSDNTENITRTIPVNFNKNKFELGRLNLIVFDFDKSELNESNRNLIENFAISSINTNSEVSITGSTDRLGEKDYNERLSGQRAENVHNIIKKAVPNSIFKAIKGVGSGDLHYDNNTPEGRFYSRTVLIEVETPAE